MTGPVFILDPADKALRERIAREMWDHDQQVTSWEMAGPIDRADYLVAADAVLAVLAEVGVPAVDTEWGVSNAARRISRMSSRESAEETAVDWQTDTEVLAGLRRRDPDYPWLRPHRRFVTSWEAAP